MYEKNGKFYADWRDADGRRRRKSFATSLGASRHETRMKTANPRRASLSLVSAAVRPLTSKPAESLAAAAPSAS